MSKRAWTLLTAGAMILSLLGGCGENAGGTAGEARCPHEIKGEQCPFCHPEMIEADGFCGEHGFAEALCAKCRPFLKAAFRAQNDWCDEHKLPESQCAECDPQLAENIRPGVHGGTMPLEDGAAGAAECNHGIAGSKCPFCTPSLIESEGFCDGHGVAEALCIACRPYLKTAFVAAGDWCEEHGTPESQCKLCNP